MLKFIAIISLICAMSLLQVRCGYFGSGRWEDDPGHWRRAWGYSKPPDVVIIHSWYWRSAHWTREEAYFFQFKWHEELFEQLVNRNVMRR